MPLPDNRLRFPAALIDFAADVGETGQSHEDFPGPSQQPRYDWLLMWFISLLSNQSSHEEPTEYREGSFWFDLSTNVLRIRYNGEWVSAANVIAVNEGTGTDGVTSLASWFQTVQNSLNTTAPESTFSGSSSRDDVTVITIPQSLRSSIISSKNRPFLWINGILVDPRNVRLCNEITIELLNGVKIDTGDSFTVVIKNITNELFKIPSVIL